MKKKRNQLILDARAMNMTVNEYKIYKKEKKMRLREKERVKKKLNIYIFHVTDTQIIYKRYFMQKK